MTSTVAISAINNILKSTPDELKAKIKEEYEKADNWHNEEAKQKAITELENAEDTEVFAIKIGSKRFHNENEVIAEIRFLPKGMAIFRTYKLSLLDT